MSLLVTLWRHLTDRKVACVCCGEALGYVVRRGHTAWICPRCAGRGDHTQAITCP